MKTLKFIGSSLDDLRDMPAAARRALGVERMTVQHGGEPSDFQKKTQKTAKADIGLAAKRYQLIGEES
ncbi:hypothetical protein [uncultured Thiocystis sp.]|jgi:phage-related protein|uniref:hypothetical protein n=1 Tax=uncultured Thiocystis sp. TaxID=1202134 RepID=UPI0025FE129D|nr:hypothetical protein [uncultured Thiocystis sp.]